MTPIILISIPSTTLPLAPRVHLLLLFFVVSHQRRCVRLPSGRLHLVLRRRPTGNGAPHKQVFVFKKISEVGSLTKFLVDINASLTLCNLYWFRLMACTAESKANMQAAIHSRVIFFTGGFVTDKFVAAYILRRVETRFKLVHTNSPSACSSKKSTIF